MTPISYIPVQFAAEFDYLDCGIVHYSGFLSVLTHARTVPENLLRSRLAAGSSGCPDCGADGAYPARIRRPPGLHPVPRRAENRVVGRQSDHVGVPVHPRAEFADITVFINENVGFVAQLEEGKLIELLRGWFSESVGSMLSQTFSGTASFLVGLVTVTVFLFLILIYRKGLVHGFVSFYPPEHREQALGMFKSIQKVGQQYLSGMMLVEPLILCKSWR